LYALPWADVIGGNPHDGTESDPLYVVAWWQTDF
jgi:hypothetical protein